MIVSLLRLTRLYYAVPMAAGYLVIVYYWVGGDISGLYQDCILSIFAICSVIAGAYVLNDVCDVNVDRINCPQRILPQQKVGLPTAIVWAMLLFGLGLILGSLCNLRFMLVLAGIVGVVTLYDFFSKRIGIAKDVVVAALMTSLYPLAFSLTDSVPSPRMQSLYISPFWLFFSTLGYEMLKDIRDVKGDKQVALTSVALYSGKPWFQSMARIIVLVGVLIAFIPFVLGYCQWLYLLFCVVGLALVLYSLRRKPTAAIRSIYLEISLVTLGAFLDLLLLGP